MNREHHIRYSVRPSLVASCFSRKLSTTVPTDLYQGFCRIYHDPDYPVYEKGELLHTVCILIDAPTREALREVFVVLADKKLPFHDEGAPLMWVHPASKEHRVVLEEHGFTRAWVRKSSYKTSICKTWFLKLPETKGETRNY